MQLISKAPVLPLEMQFSSLSYFISTWVRRRVTFICGRAGVCALGAVAAKNSGDGHLLDHYISLFKEVDEMVQYFKLPGIFSLLALNSIYLFIFLFFFLVFTSVVVSKKAKKI